MGLPDLMIVHVGRGLATTFDKARQMSAMDEEKSHGCSHRGRGPVTTLDTA